MDRLRAFEIFTTVIAQNSFTGAADLLGTSAANVTRYIADLEAHLGARLINRTSRRMSLTEAGASFYERARLILDDVADAETIASATTLSPRGRLRINAPLSFGVLHLSPLWPRFREQYPEIELDIVLSDRVVDIVEEGFDLAVRISGGGSQSHVARKLATSHNIICASPGYVQRRGMPVIPSELEAHDCIVYSYAQMAEEWHMQDAAGKVHSARPRIVMRTNNGDTARVMALNGQGMIWQPTFLVGDDLRAGRLVRLLPDFHLPDIDILAVYASRRQLSGKLRVMLDFLGQSFQGTPSWDV